MVRQYDLIKMEDDEDIETMFLIFQTCFHDLKIKIKNYPTTHHV